MDKTSLTGMICPHVGHHPPLALPTSSLCNSHTLVHMIHDLITTSFSCAHTAHGIYTAIRTKILDAKCDKTDPTDVVQKCTYISSEQCISLCDPLSKISRWFSGKLGRYVKQTFSIFLKHTTPIFSIILTKLIRIIFQSLKRIRSSICWRSSPKSDYK